MSKGTTKRSIRVDDPLWGKAKEVAAELGDDLSTILRAALINYIGEGTSMSISKEAIKAASQAVKHCEDRDSEALARAALEAAAPYMLAPVFDEGVKAGADYQFKLAHALEHGKMQDPAPIPNPYRSQA